ncbi:hypothetical protein I308_103394 [Cryptococcus tetragattii IND107]|uniref:Uncharacterized protein n=1 Tax=Cryptococcus tetragattii IND107 TaxID=1296105 RepID=A0ABR3BT14_9TREE
MSAVNLPYHCHHLQHAPAIPTTAVVLLTSLFQPYVNGVIVSRVLEFETSKIRLSCQANVVMAIVCRRSRPEQTLITGLQGVMFQHHYFCPSFA